MARDLGDQPNELRIHDNISDSEIVLFYRTPTTQEHIRYSNELYQRKRNRIVPRLGETRHKFGMAILEGFRDGDFSRNGRPIASDSKSSDHDPRWKELIEARASDLVEALAIHVFEASSEAQPVEEDEEPEPAGPEGEDAEKN